MDFSSYRRPVLALGLGSALALGMVARAEVPATLTAATPSAAPAADGGPFGWLDSRSAYNADFFTQPLLVDDTSLEDGELEFSSLHTSAGAQHSDTIAGGGQKSFGLLTLEISVPYERMSDAANFSQGLGNISVGGRYPLYQLVAANGFFDTTFGVAGEVGIPVNSTVSKNAEVVPKVFDDLRLGEHFSLQTVLGYATILGSGETGGVQSFDYGFAFGWKTPHAELAVPGIRQITPLFELSGETQLNQSAAGQNSLLGSLGVRIDFASIGDIHPSIGLGYIFPVDNGAHTEVHWGIASSLTLEF